MTPAQLAAAGAAKVVGSGAGVIIGGAPVIGAALIGGTVSLVITGTLIIPYIPIVGAVVGIVAGVKKHRKKKKAKAKKLEDLRTKEFERLDTLQQGQKFETKTPSQLRTITIPKLSIEVPSGITVVGGGGYTLKGTEIFTTINNIILTGTGGPIVPTPVVPPGKPPEIPEESYDGPYNKRKCDTDPGNITVTGSDINNALILFNELNGGNTRIARAAIDVASQGTRIALNELINKTGTSIGGDTPLDPPGMILYIEDPKLLDGAGQPLTQLDEGYNKPSLIITEGQGGTGSTVVMPNPIAESFGDAYRFNISDTDAVPGSVEFLNDILSGLQTGQVIELETIVPTGFITGGKLTPVSFPITPVQKQTLREQEVWKTWQEMYNVQPLSDYGGGTPYRSHAITEDAQSMYRQDDDLSDPEEELPQITGTDIQVEEAPLGIPEVKNYTRPEVIGDAPVPSPNLQPAVPEFANPPTMIDPAPEGLSPADVPDVPPSPGGDPYGGFDIDIVPEPKGMPWKPKGDPADPEPDYGSGGGGPKKPKKKPIIVKKVVPESPLTQFVPAFARHVKEEEIEIEEKLPAGDLLGLEPEGMFHYGSIIKDVDQPFFKEYQKGLDKAKKRANIKYHKLTKAEKAAGKQPVLVNFGSIVRLTKVVNSFTKEFWKAKQTAWEVNAGMQEAIKGYRGAYGKGSEKVVTKSIIISQAKGLMLQKQFKEAIDVFKRGMPFEVTKTLKEAANIFVAGLAPTDVEKTKFVEGHVFKSLESARQVELTRWLASDTQDVVAPKVLAKVKVSERLKRLRSKTKQELKSAWDIFTEGLPGEWELEPQAINLDEAKIKAASEASEPVTIKKKVISRHKGLMLQKQFEEAIDIFKKGLPQIIKKLEAPTFQVQPKSKFYGHTAKQGMHEIDAFSSHMQGIHEVDKAILENKGGESKVLKDLEKVKASLKKAIVKDTGLYTREEVLDLIYMAEEGGIFRRQPFDPVEKSQRLFEGVGQDLSNIEKEINELIKELSGKSIEIQRPDTSVVFGATPEAYEHTIQKYFKTSGKTRLSFKKATELKKAAAELRKAEKISESKIEQGITPPLLHEGVFANEPPEYTVETENLQLEKAASPADNQKVTDLVAKGSEYLHAVENVNEAIDAAAENLFNWDPNKLSPKQETIVTEAVEKLNKITKRKGLSESKPKLGYGIGFDPVQAKSTIARLKEKLKATVTDKPKPKPSPIKKVVKKKALQKEKPSQLSTVKGQLERAKASRSKLVASLKQEQVPAQETSLKAQIDKATTYIEGRKRFLLVLESRRETTKVIRETTVHQEGLGEISITEKESPKLKRKDKKLALNNIALQLVKHETSGGKKGLPPSELEEAVDLSPKDLKAIKRKVSRLRRKGTVKRTDAKLIPKAQAKLEALRAPKAPVKVLPPKPKKLIKSRIPDPPKKLVLPTDPYEDPTLYEKKYKEKIKKSMAKLEKPRSTQETAFHEKAIEYKFSLEKGKAAIKHKIALSERKIVSLSKQKRINDKKIVELEKARDERIKAYKKARTKEANVRKQIQKQIFGLTSDYVKAKAEGKLETPSVTKKLNIKIKKIAARAKKLAEDMKKKVATGLLGAAGIKKSDTQLKLSEGFTASTSKSKVLKLPINIVKRAIKSGKEGFEEGWKKHQSPVPEDSVTGRKLERLKKLLYSLPQPPIYSKRTSVIVKNYEKLIATEIKGLRIKKSSKIVPLEKSITDLNKKIQKITAQEEEIKALVTNVGAAKMTRRSDLFFNLEVRKATRRLEKTRRKFTIQEVRSPKTISLVRIQATLDSATEELEKERKRAIKFWSTESPSLARTFLPGGGLAHTKHQLKRKKIKKRLKKIEELGASATKTIAGTEEAIEVQKVKRRAEKITRGKRVEAGRKLLVKFSERKLNRIRAKIKEIEAEGETATKEKVILKLIEKEEKVRALALVGSKEGLSKAKEQYRTLKTRLEEIQKTINLFTTKKTRTESVRGQLLEAEKDLIKIREIFKKMPAIFHAPKPAVTSLKKSVKKTLKQATKRVTKGEITLDDIKRILEEKKRGRKTSKKLFRLDKPTARIGKAPDGGGDDPFDDPSYLPGGGPGEPYVAADEVMKTFGAPLLIGVTVIGALAGAGGTVLATKYIKKHIKRSRADKEESKETEKLIKVVTKVINKEKKETNKIDALAPKKTTPIHPDFDVKSFTKTINERLL